MTSYFSAEDVDSLNRGREEVHNQFATLRERFVARAYKSDRAREYARHGFGRRLGTLVRAIDIVYEILPPEREDIPERDEVVEATIAIHAFVMNTFGCLDNLAWIWVFERDVKGKDGKELERKKVGLGSKIVRDSFTDGFREYVDSRQKWFDHLKEFRDSLAHRIPLYIPPYVVLPKDKDEYNKLQLASNEAARKGDTQEYDRIDLEQMKLGTFRPWMTHSIHEQSPSVVFHNQLLNDYVTIDEYGRTMLDELDR